MGELYQQAKYDDADLRTINTPHNSSEIRTAKELTREASWYSWWRIYLYAHLMAVAGLCVVVTKENADYFQRGTWHDSAISMGTVLMPAAMVAIPMAYASPVILFIFLRRWIAGEGRYGVAASAEFAIALANWYALLPAVQ